MAISWAKKGADAQKMIKEEEERKKLEAEQRGRLYRYFLKPSEDAKLTFVDGNLTEDGNLDALVYREHCIMHNGKWTDFVCVADDEPCPLCESGDKPNLVSALTVIDHRTYTGKKDKVYKDTRKLFIFKQATYKMLQKFAVKRGGLAGCTFDVSRTGEKEPNVGDVFDFNHKELDLSVLQKQYVREVEINGVKTMQCQFEAADYEKELPYFNAAALREMGYGNSKLSHAAPTTTAASSNVSTTIDEEL